MEMLKATDFQKSYFTNLFELYYKALVNYVYGIVRDEEVAKDLINNVFFTVWKKRLDIAPKRSIQSWLYIQARNQAFDWLRHLQVIRNNEANLMYDLELTEDIPEDYDQRLERVIQKLEVLPEKQKRVVEECCMFGRSYKEVADELNISVNTLKTHLTRAIRFLRNELKDDLYLLFFNFSPWGK